MTNTTYPSNPENVYKLHPDVFTQFNHVKFIAKTGDISYSSDYGLLLDALDALADIIAGAYHPDYDENGNLK